MLNLRPSVSGENAPVKTHIREDTFRILSLLGLAWNTINVFKDLSFMFVIGFTAGGLPTIFYGLYVFQTFKAKLLTHIFHSVLESPSVAFASRQPLQNVRP
jgi:hypothetical protein